MYTRQMVQQVQDKYMLYAALDKRNNDLIKIEGKGIARVDKGRFVAQQVQCKLKTIKGEWILDKTIGFVDLTDISKQYDKFELETKITEEVLGVKGVKSIDEISFYYEKDRSIVIKFKAKTIYGEISTEIPWSNFSYLGIDNLI